MEMYIIPSVDIKDGRCVKLVEGRAGSGMVLGDPLSIAKFWEREGAEVLHVIDLDGAIEGFRKNREIIARIIEEVDIPVEVGGGLRSIEEVIEILEIGASWAIVGTKVLEDSSFLPNLLERVDSSRIIVAIDSRRGRVVKKGWLEETCENPVELARRLEGLDVAAFLYTEVGAEGRELGVNIEAIEALTSSLKVPILYAGGISSLKDLIALAKLGVRGAIVGSALYKGRFTLREAKLAIERTLG